MEPEKHLLADFASSDFVCPPTSPSAVQQGVLPVVAIRGEEFRPVGTCFVVASQGLVLTARHVVEEALQLGEGAAAVAGQATDGWGIGVLYLREPRQGEKADTDLVGGVLPVRSVHVNPDLDIAAMTLRVPINAETGLPLELAAHSLSPRLPAVGTHCFAVGYHSMKWAMPEEGSHDGLTIFQSLSVSRGQVEELHVPRRDTSSLHFPCFRSSARYDKGMSGGPVLGMNGKVVGVVCSSFDTGEEHQGFISYVSLVGPALVLEVEASDHTGVTKPRGLIEFVTAGSIDTDASIAEIAVLPIEGGFAFHYRTPDPATHQTNPVSGLPSGEA